MSKPRWERGRNVMSLADLFTQCKAIPVYFTKKAKEPEFYRSWKDETVDTLAQQIRHGRMAFARRTEE